MSDFFSREAVLCLEGVHQFLRGTEEAANQVVGAP